MLTKISSILMKYKIRVTIKNKLKADLDPKVNIFCFLIKDK